MGGQAGWWPGGGARSEQGPDEGRRGEARWELGPDEGQGVRSDMNRGQGWDHMEVGPYGGMVGGPDFSRSQMGQGGARWE